MPLLLTMVRAFINFFGITKPSAAKERQAAMFIGSLMVLIVCATLLFLLAFSRMHA